MSREEFVEFVDAVCGRPKLYFENGTFFTIIAFLEGYALNRVEPTFSDKHSHMPFANFLKWVLTNRGIDCRKPHGGWKTFREHYKSDREALDDFPNLFCEFLGILR